MISDIYKDIELHFNLLFRPFLCLHSLCIIMHILCFFWQGHGFLTVFNGPDLEHKILNLRRNTGYKFRVSDCCMRYLRCLIQQCVIFCSLKCPVLHNTGCTRQAVVFLHCTNSWLYSLAPTASSQQRRGWFQMERDGVLQNAGWQTCCAAKTSTQRACPRQVVQSYLG